MTRKELEEKIKYLSFIKLEFKIDKQKSIDLYNHEYKHNINQTRDCQLSYNQWLQIKEFECIDLWTSLQ